MGSYHTFICVLIILLNFNKASTLDVDKGVDTCGALQHSTAEKIIGGHPNDLYAADSIRYQVVLHNSYTDFCGGTILDDWHILTAAHCVVEHDEPMARPIYIVTGSKILIPGAPNVYEIDAFFVPKMFESSSETCVPGDIAVLRLNASLNLDINRLLTSVQLPEPEPDNVNSYENLIGTIVGYGTYLLKRKSDGKTIREPLPVGERRYLEAEEVFPETLIVAKVDIVSQKECKNIWKVEKLIHPTQMCARVQGTFYRGACSGDSGNGLIYNDTVIGVLSFGNDYCYEGELASGQPGVYTKVTSWLAFIKKAMDNDTSANDMHHFVLRGRSNRNYSLLDLLMAFMVIVIILVTSF